MTADTCTVAAPKGSWGVERGLSRLAAALSRRGVRLERTSGPGAQLHLRFDATLPAGSYQREAGASAIAAADGPAAQYALDDLAEALDAGTDLAALPARTSLPRFAFRAAKINLPWMSYRAHPSLALHDEACRDLAFWRDLLDTLADNRFNALTLWSMHPFHLMVRSQEFPEACDLSEADLDDWRRLWHGIFALAQERGLATYLVTWNIFVSPAFARAHGLPYSLDGSAHIGDGVDTPTVRRYTRSVISQTLREYPELTGLGTTLGERMGGMTPQEREGWLLDTVVAGLRDAGRSVRFIHRGPLSADRGSGGSTSSEAIAVARAGISAMRPEQPVWLELKFNWSHGHSTPDLRLVHGGAIPDGYWSPPPQDYRVVWTIRNEDIFVLRWGEPGFIRALLARNGQDWVGGFIVGAECMIPAAEYTMRPEAGADWRWAFQRQWLFWRLWGRLLHDPATADTVFAADFERRCGPGSGAPLLAAATLACRMPLRLATWMAATWDFTLYAEGFLRAGSPPGGLISLDDLIAARPLDPTWQPIPERVADLARGVAPPPGATPESLAEALDADADAALRLLAPLPRHGACGFEVTDLTVWAGLGRFFAARLRAALALERHRAGHGTAYRAETLACLEAALAHWRAAAAAAEPMHPPVPLIHLGDRPFSWTGFIPDLERELAELRNGGRSAIDAHE